MKKPIVPSVLIISGSGAAAFAHGGAAGIVRERMDAMMAMSDAVKTPAPMMRGETAYDGETVRRAAGQIGALSGELTPRLFSEGSGGAPSQTKDAVWRNWDEFTGLAEQLHIYAEGLALAADNGLMSGPGVSTTGMMGGNAMMGGGSMMLGQTGEDGAMGPEELAEMPADDVFAMAAQVCLACHAKFHAESK